MAKILITGGSGLVGRAISELLLQQGHEPVWLSREKGYVNGIKKYKWDVLKQQIDETAFQDVESIIHLAGSGIIDKKWTSSYKKEIIDSRVKSSMLLFDIISKNNYKVKTLVGSSAVGYYGNQTSNHSYSENDNAGNDFLAKTCKAWEKSYVPFINSGLRTVVIRTGIVLSKEGGAYKKMIPPFKFGLGTYVGSGKQYFPWIHIKDLACIFVFSLFNERLTGTYNAVSSHPITNKEFSKHLAKSLKRPFFLPHVPESLLKLVLGERAITLTGGIKINNDKIKKAGFPFGFDDIDNALNNLASTN